MLLIQNGFECAYEMEIFIKLFFDKNEDVYIYTNLVHEKNRINVYTEILFGDAVYFEDYYLDFDLTGADRRLKKKIFTCACTNSFCHAAQKIRAVSIPWGVLSGIRPAKSVRLLREEGKTAAEAAAFLKKVYEVSDEKIELAMEVARSEERILKQIGSNSVSLYIGIPFCPTRCLYCSFVSTDMRVSGKYMEGFVECLVREIAHTGALLKTYGMYAENIYIGGGTPTTLSAGQLALVFDAVKTHIGTGRVKEYTLEAGRPDTITDEKLRAAKQGGVNRISINPQTMNQKTLDKIGRRHTPELVYEAFRMARANGFDNINMDLIAGLPDEAFADFKYSLDEVAALDPENITVHSMCVKRAAALRFSDTELAQARVMNRMLGYTQRLMRETGRAPYYMYRQKNISGNLENVGYAKAGTESFYNVNIMEEAQTIVALGGGGSSKVVVGDRIERVFNFKEPLEYIRRFDEILEKKDAVFRLLKD